MLNNVKLKKALRPRPMQARLANGRFAPKSVKVVAKAVKEETTKKSEPKLVPDLITEQPKIKKATRNSLTEISQRYASQMNLLIRNEDGFEELHQPFRCRDYFSELIAFQQLPTSITKNWSKAQYGFRYQIKHRLSPDTEYFLQVITKSPFCMDYLNGTLPEEFRSTLIGEWEQDRCRVTLITVPWAYFMNSHTMHYFTWAVRNAVGMKEEGYSDYTNWEEFVAQERERGRVIDPLVTYSNKKKQIGVLPEFHRHYREKFKAAYALDCWSDPDKAQRHYKEKIIQGSFDLTLHNIHEYTGIQNGMWKEYNV